ncbi:MAG: recombination and strand exchange inhibitor protein [Haloplasmataceae bacterium]|nr:recombination and strand exchange inhibitor protein [Haloplasmataceae bacterium]
MINKGDKVLIKKLNKKGEVISVFNNGIYVVELESLKFHVKINELEEINEKKTININKNHEYKLFKTTNPFKYNVNPLEIDLHGFTLKEAKVAVEDIIQKAIYQKITVVHIIHGKGSGVLRIGIQDLLRSYKTKKMITKYNYAEYHEGSYGKTIVYI